MPVSTAGPYPAPVICGVKPPMAPCHTCRWVSTRPGMTSRPAASITSASAVAGRRSGPTAVITPSVASTSPTGRSPRSGSTVTTWPP